VGRLLRIYVLPGAILQSVNIAGGYGTGRELVEFFTRHGMGNGLAGLVLATTLMSLVFALSLVLAQRFQVYDYRSFFKVLLGRAWFLFEVLAVLLFILVLAVMGAAAGAIIQQEIGIPRVVGGLVLLVGVVTLNFFGRDWVTRVLATWSVVLYAVFIAYFLAVVTSAPPATESATFAWEWQADWVVSAFQYALYNVAAVPVILYAARAIENGRQALLAGLAGGLITMFPAMLFHLSFVSAYPDIVFQDLPVYAMFDGLSVPALQIVYLIVLFGTFVETGAGNIQGLIERLDTWWRERRGTTLSRGAHALVAATAVSASAVLSMVGVVDLIAGGYGRIAWGYLVVFLIPLFTVGVYRLTRTPAPAVLTSITTDGPSTG
jgi:uncharacterized membrane protein YkvI